VARCKVQGLYAVNCAKTAEPVDIAFWVVHSGGSKEACNLLDGVHMDATWEYD